MKKWIAVILASYSLFLASQASASLIFYTDRTLFETENPGLPVEDFEEATTAPFGVDGIDEPLNAVTASGPFVPGDILPGLTVATFEGIRSGCPIECALVSLGDGLIGNADIIVGPNFFVDTMLLIFSPGVMAVGLDLLVPVAETFDVEIFGDSGSLGTTTAAASPTGLFFGVASDMGPITSIHISSPTGAGELADNIAFGNPTLTVPAPATAALLLLGLCFCGRRQQA